jgi:hypothetical protein
MRSTSSDDVSAIFASQPNPGTGVKYTLDAPAVIVNARYRHPDRAGGVRDGLLTCPAPEPHAPKSDAVFCTTIKSVPVAGAKLSVKFTVLPVAV